MSANDYLRRPSCRRLVWVAFANLLTFIVPDIFLRHVVRLTTSASRRAWREKVALFFSFIFLAALFCFWLEYVSLFFCDPQKPLEYSYVFSNESKYAAINGKAVNWTRYIGTSDIADFVSNNPHRDLSAMFPKFMLLDRSSSEGSYSDDILNQCIYNQNKSSQADAWLTHRLTKDPGYSYVNKQLVSCPLPGHPNITGAPCYFGEKTTSIVDGYAVKGDIEYTEKEIDSYFNALPAPGNLTKQGFVILDGYVLDVTYYLDSATSIIPLSPTMSSRSFALNRMFLPLDVTTLLYINLGKDITTYFAGNVSGDSDLYRKCLVHLFSHGVAPTYISGGCYKINPALWATMGVGLLYFLVKMNLVYLSRVTIIQRLFFSPTPQVSTRIWPHTILTVPCYAESSDTLKQTLDTLARTTYDDTKKLLLFVCDGLVTSMSEERLTHELLLQALGHSSTEEPMTHSYLSLGQDTRKLNYARVYSGYYETGRNRVPYLVLVKMGQPREAHEKERAAGNRGKRDSLLIVMSFLERCMNLANNRITPLEYELFNQCYNVLGIDPRSFKYLMVTDADTQVQGDVVQMMVTRMERDRKLLAVSGHVRPANPEQNLTTMLQIFPVYMTFFSGLAYEACLKSVMTINGGLVMYKIWTDNLPVQKEKSRFLSWQLQRSKTTSTSQQAIHSKWPKVSDEINPFQDDDDDESLSSTRQTNSRLSLSASIDIRPCCVHPTVLRGLATPQPNTMHMQNVLLLGEDRYLSTLLLQSHPHHRLGFEPDAVGYVTLPTHFLSLVGHQVRNIRAGFHTRLEQHRVTWQLGVTYWILSTSEILDMIFSMPIIVYLYGIFGRSLKNMGQAYVIIACSFTGLVVLHMLFFLLRRQFRYILWFVLYCLISVPLFAVLFPLLAAWQSDYAERWYDVWPTTAGRGTRLHGIIDRSATLKQQGEPHQENEEEEEDNKEKKKDEKSMTDDVPRLRLGEYEVAEAKRLNQAAEAALDSNFTGFTGFASEPSSIHSNQSNEKQDNLISTPPLVQVREGIHSTRLAGYQHKNNLDGLWRNREERRHSNDNANPFADPIAENPFDDEFGAMEETIRTKHKPTQSQSSYFTFLSNDLKADTVDGSTLPSSLNSSGFAKIPAYGDVLSYKESTETEPSPEEDQDVQDRASTLSIISNTFSISSAHSNEHRLPQHHRFGAADTPQPSLDEGRHTAIHTNMSSNMRHVNTSNVSLRHTGANVGSSPLRTRRKKGLLVAPSNSSLSHHYRHQSIDDGSDMKLVLRNEVRNYLQQANLDLITRAQVKQHLVTLFGSKIEQEEWLEYVNECIEETTLSFMSESTQ